jgi:hypothetical protein
MQHHNISLSRCVPGFDPKGNLRYLHMVCGQVIADGQEQHWIATVRDHYCLTCEVPFKYAQ